MEHTIRNKNVMEEEVDVNNEYQGNAKIGRREYSDDNDDYNNMRSADDYNGNRRDDGHNRITSNRGRSSDSLNGRSNGSYNGNRRDESDNGIRSNDKFNRSRNSENQYKNSNENYNPSQNKYRVLYLQNVQFNVNPRYSYDNKLHMVRDFIQRHGLSLFFEDNEDNQDFSNAIKFKDLYCFVRCTYFATNVDKIFPKTTGGTEFSEIVIQTSKKDPFAYQASKSSDQTSKIVLITGYMSDMKPEYLEYEILSAIPEFKIFQFSRKTAFVETCDEEIAKLLVEKLNGKICLQQRLTAVFSEKKEFPVLMEESLYRLDNYHNTIFIKSNHRNPSKRQRTHGMILFYVYIIQLNRSFVDDRDFQRGRSNDRDGYYDRVDEEYYNRR